MQEAVTGCQGRDTLVDLREHMPNATNVIQVADYCQMGTLLKFRSHNSNRLLRLELDSSDKYDALPSQVIPDFATVKRCGGSCDMHSHRCVATSTQMRRLEVMVVLSQFPVQRTVTECGFVEVM